MKHLSFSLVTVLFLVACAGISPETLRAVTEEKSITVKEVKYEKYMSFAGNRFYHTIMPGKYAAKYQDDLGTYFEGNDNCFSIQVHKDGESAPYPPHSYRCGIFVPNARNEEPKLYFYKDPTVSAAIFGNTAIEVVDSKGVRSTVPGAQTGGALGMAIVRAADAAELKNLHFYADQPKPGQLRSAME